MSRCWIFLALLAVRSGAEAEIVRHFYFLNDTASWKSLAQNHAAVSLLSPVWFAVTPAGTLESTLDLKLLDWAAEKKLPVMPVLVNKGFNADTAHALLTSERAQEKVISSLLKIAALHRFEGIQLDLENIPAGDRDRYSHFVERLALALHNLQMKLSVAVVSPYAADPQDGSWPRSPHAASFDYFQLANAADFLTLMAYDQHTSPDQPGPIAGFPWVEACVQKLLEVVPSSKLLLGLPLYYRRWGADRVTEGPYKDAYALAARHQVKIQQDATQAESVFQFDEGERQHVVWLNGAADLRKRLELVHRYRLRGYSAWRLGQEDPAAWSATFSTTATAMN